MRSMLKPTISLFVICVAVAAALAFTYLGTKDAKSLREELETKNTMKEVLPEAEKFESIKDISALAGSRPDFSIIKDAYKGFKEKSLAGYVFLIENKGYAGIIKISVGIDKTGKITGVKIGENNETPGLGAKAAEEPFISQFKGLTPAEKLKVVKNGKTKPEEIEAISGATITSKAVVGAVQAAVEMASKINKTNEGVSGQ